MNIKKTMIIMTITVVVLTVKEVGTLVTFNTTVLDSEPTYLSSPA